MVHARYGNGEIYNGNGDFDDNNCAAMWETREFVTFLNPDDSIFLYTQQ